MAIQRRLVGQQLRHARIQFRNAVTLIETKNLARRIGTETKTVPDFAFEILVATKQDAARRVAGQQNHDRFGLGKTAQVIKVAVVAVEIVRVAITQTLRRSRQYRCASLHGGGQTRPARGENSAEIDGIGSGFHAANYTRPRRKSRFSLIKRSAVPTSHQRPPKCSPVT